jgi:hypothetical protein
MAVGAAKNGTLARRVCEATLNWDKKAIPVVREAWQVDIDALGVDLGLKTPVVAFQIKKTDIDSRMTYEVYSLQKPPRLLRAITGGDFFSAADTDLDGRVEIWTGDASAVDGFENLALDDLDFAPTVVRRFEKQRLMDVSSEFQSHYDRQIAQVRTQVDSQQLSDFKNSDGKLSASTMSALSMDHLHRLLVTKIKVLEIVWAYLYSGREQDAWHTLADMWPPADFDRIRASILSGRGRGISSEVDGASPGTSRFRRKKHAIIYNTATNHFGSSGTTEERGPQSMLALTADISPEPILLRTAPPPDNEQALPTSEKFVDVVVDAAGKVRSASMGQEADKSLINSSSEWKFIPASKDGDAVASRMRLGLTLFR